jgi:hypothetical protein
MFVKVADVLRQRPAIMITPIVMDIAITQCHQRIDRIPFDDRAHPT